MRKVDQNRKILRPQVLGFASVTAGLREHGCGTIQITSKHMYDLVAAG